MAYHWTLATILSASRAGEKDKRLTLFSREMGKVTATARGTAVTDGKWSTSFEPFSLLYLRLYERSHFFTVVESEERAVYTRILLSLSKSLKGMAINQLTACFLEPSSEEPELFASYVSALSHLNVAEDLVSEDRIFLQFMVDVLHSLGFGLDSLYCERCGALLSDEVFFSTVDNSFRCRHCASLERDIPLSTELARFLQSGQETIDERHVLIGIAVTLRLLRSAASKLTATRAFESFAQNAATLFHSATTQNYKESQHEL